ncbi:MAG: hypothetical protein U0V48_01910 [Anaerolineales bacterium]
MTVLADWGEEISYWKQYMESGIWSLAELNRLHDSITLLASAMGGNETFKKRNLGAVAVKKSKHRLAWRGSVQGSGRFQLLIHSPHGQSSTSSLIWDEKSGLGFISST